MLIREVEKRQQAYRIGVYDEFLDAAPANRAGP
jgi:hypothetical protein